LSEEKPNPPLDEKLFQFRVPSGVEVVDVGSEPDA
jgi:hypothetical protein